MSDAYVCPRALRDVPRVVRCTYTAHGVRHSIAWHSGYNEVLPMPGAAESLYPYVHVVPIILPAERVASFQ